jgi:hypothetical protein
LILSTDYILPIDFDLTPQSLQEQVLFPRGFSRLYFRTILHFYPKAYLPTLHFSLQIYSIPTLVFLYPLLQNHKLVSGEGFGEIIIKARENVSLVRTYQAPDVHTTNHEIKGLISPARPTKIDKICFSNCQVIEWDFS